MHNRRMFLTPLLLLVLLLLPVTAAIAQDNPVLTKSSTLLQEEKYAEVRDLLDLELQKEDPIPDNVRATMLFQLGYALTQLEEYRASIQTWHKMLELVKTHPIVWGNLGWSYYLVGDVDSAIIATEKSILFNSSQAWVWGNMGLYRLAKGDIPKMKEAYAKAGELAQEEDTWKSIRADLDVYCGDGKREGCKEAYACIDKGMLISLERWYSEADAEKGKALVQAHHEEFERIFELLSEAPEPEDDIERELKAAMMERLEKDLK
ncbi:MAG: hypothetical protein JXA28_10130 [Bacteroidetes bacterium]|nr:hypothetical protein [Bacteroidota bacterium]